MQHESRQDPNPFATPGAGNPCPGQGQGNPATGGTGASDDFLRMKSWIQQAKQDAERARAIAEQTREDVKELQRELEEHGRKSSRAGWAAALLAMVLLGAAVYGYYRLQSGDTLLAQFPALHAAVNSVGERMNAAEEKLRAWSGDWEGMNARLQKVEQTAGATLRQARDYATQQSAKVQQELQAELNNRTQAANAALGKLEAARQQDEQRIAQLQKELAEVRNETNQQVARSREEANQQIGSLRSQVSRNRSEFEAVARMVAQVRRDFEISKNQTREVAPGITLTVSDLNVSYQRVEGRLHLIPEGRILWIRGQGIQQPVRFYSIKDSRPFELVFTRVGPGGAVGYLLVPEGADLNTSAAAPSFGDVAVAANSTPVEQGTAVAP